MQNEHSYCFFLSLRFFSFRRSSFHSFFCLLLSSVKWIKCTAQLSVPFCCAFLFTFAFFFVFLNIFVFLCFYDAKYDISSSHQKFTEIFIFFGASKNEISEYLFSKSFAFSAIRKAEKRREMQKEEGCHFREKGSRWCRKLSKHKCRIRKDIIFSPLSS